MQHHPTVQNCFNSILRLREAHADSSCAQDVHAALTVALRRLISAPEVLGPLIDDAQDVVLVVAALADEAAMRKGDEIAELWRAQALQMVFFNHYDAGELFYERLHAIPKVPNKQAVLSVFYTALVLGFEGRLADPHGREERMRLVATMRRVLFGQQHSHGFILANDALARRKILPRKSRLSAASTIVLALFVSCMTLCFGLRSIIRGRVQQVLDLAELRQAQLETLKKPDAGAYDLAQEAHP